MSHEHVKRSLQDTEIFGFDFYEITKYSEEIIEYVSKIPGHYTIKVDPLASKRYLQQANFYYCDSLIEPFITRNKLKISKNCDSSVSEEVDLSALLPICKNAFVHGRFHRDFNLDSGKADLRYQKWLITLYENGAVYGLFWKKDLAGFVAYDDNLLVLHAVSASFRGKGLAKYWWVSVCEKLFEKGFEELRSSVSTTNSAVMNLYSSLGFSFRNPKDIYHMVVRN